jgi:2-C-methyl-D-erythritol 4-phosphate cytidylyltransferase/2-C-methyl-D-erythritol 2,4-cyclodiphosphate synthase
MASRPHIVALIVAAGSGSRVGGTIPKQFCNVKGQPMLRHSYAVFTHKPEIKDIFVVVGAKQDDLARAALDGLPPPVLVTGGATRLESVRNGLDEIAKSGGADYVLIHDAARPFLSDQVIDDLLDALLIAPGAVPALPVVDSIARGADILTEAVERENLWRIQTPQAFHFQAIYEAHRNWGVDDSTDDARMMMSAGGEVRIVNGDEALSKITFSFDMTEQEMGVSFRSGTGFDVHRLVTGEQLWLCGVLIPYDKGLSGHSDADVAMHALTDAMLGALALGDIGDHFPPSDPQWKGASSDRFLAHALKLAREMGFELANADITIICEAPKIGPHRLAMRARIAEIIDTDIDRISVKATTTEMLGFTGRGEGIAAQAIATFEKMNR